MLPKSARLSSEREIKKTLKDKQYESKGPLLYVAANENSLSESRLAVVIPKKLGKAVARNRVRRVFQAAFDNIRRKIAKNIDIVVFPRSAAFGLKTPDIEAGLVKCLSRIKLH